APGGSGRGAGAVLGAGSAGCWAAAAAPSAIVASRNKSILTSVSPLCYADNTVREDMRQISPNRRDVMPEFASGLGAEAQYLHVELALLDQHCALVRLGLCSRSRAPGRLLLLGLRAFLVAGLACPGRSRNRGAQHHRQGNGCVGDKLGH